MNLKKYNISTKVLLPWFLFLILFSGLIVFRVTQINKNSEREHHTANHRQMLSLANEIQLTEKKIWILSLQYLALRAPSVPLDITKSLEKLEKKTLALENLTENGSSHNNIDQARIHDNKAFLESYFISRVGRNGLYRKFISSIKEDDINQINKLVYILADKFKIINATLDDLRIYHMKLASLIELERTTASNQSEWLFFSLLATMIIFGIIFSRYQIRTIANPISSLTVNALCMLQGKDADFTIYQGKNEIGQLSSAFSQLINSLKETNLEISKQRDKIQRAYGEAETKVIERTRELIDKTTGLEEANSQLESFSYTVSHDLRAPLRALAGFAHLLQKKSAGMLDEKCDHYVQVIYDSAAQMGQLIDDLLSFSRMSRSEMVNEIVDLDGIIQNILPMYAKETEDRNIEWKIENLPEVQGDQALLKQVFSNLIDNAVK